MNAVGGLALAEIGLGERGQAHAEAQARLDDVEQIGAFHGLEVQRGVGPENFQVEAAVVEADDQGGGEKVSDQLLNLLLEVGPPDVPVQIPGDGQGEAQIADVSPSAHLGRELLCLQVEDEPARFGARLGGLGARPGGLGRHTLGGRSHGELTLQNLRQQQGGGLVEGLVAVPAFGRLDARGAAQFARAVADDPRRGLQEELEPLVALAAQPHAARVPVVDEDRRATHLRVHGVGDAAQIPAVREGREREDADEGVFQGVDAAHEVHPARGHLGGDARRDGEPEAFRLEGLGGRLQRVFGDGLAALKALLDEAREDLRHLHPSQEEGEGAQITLGEGFQDLCLLVAADLRVVVHLGGSHGDLAVLLRKRHDLVGPSLVKVDGTLVALAVDAVAVHVAHGLACGIHDGVALPHGPQVHLAVRVAPQRVPRRALAVQDQVAGAAQVFQGDSARCARLELFFVQGALAGGAEQVRRADARVVRVQH